jgi:hypothetical protein
LDQRGLNCATDERGDAGALQYLFHPRQSGLSNFCGGDGFENFEAGGELSDRATSEELRKYLEGLNDDDLGKYKM